MSTLTVFASIVAGRRLDPMYAGVGRRKELLAESATHGMSLIDGVQNESSIRCYPDLDTHHFGNKQPPWSPPGNSHPLSVVVVLAFCVVRQRNSPGIVSRFLLTEFCSSYLFSSLRASVTWSFGFAR